MQITTSQEMPDYQQLYNKAEVCVAAETADPVKKVNLYILFVA